MSKTKRAAFPVIWVALLSFAAGCRKDNVDTSNAPPDVSQTDTTETTETFVNSNTAQMHDPALQWRIILFLGSTRSG